VELRIIVDEIRCNGPAIGKVMAFRIKNELFILYKSRAVVVLE